MAYLKGKKNPTYKRNGYKVVSGFRIYFEPHISSTSPYMIRLSGKGNIRKRFKTSEEAENFAQIKSIEVKNQGTQSLDFTEAMKKDSLKAMSILKPFGVSLTACAEYFAKHEDKVDYDITVQALVNSFLKDSKASDVRPRTLQNYTHMLNDFSNAFGKLSVKTISHTDIDKYLLAWSDKLTSRKRRLSAISIFFNYLIKNGIVESNPTKKCERIKVRDRKAPEIWNEIEVVQMLQYASFLFLPVMDARPYDNKYPDALELYLAIGFYSGIRPQEILRLKWKDINFKNKTIHISSDVAKERKPRIVEIYDVLLEFLRCKQNNYALDKSSNVIPLSSKQLTRRTNKLMKALGLNWKQDAMRHTFATYHMAKYGIDKTRRILGHSTNNIMFDFYIGLSENLEKEANRFFDPKRKTKLLKSTKA